jgi:predicted tellurium resistance membrane protein TerC
MEIIDHLVTLVLLLLLQAVLGFDNLLYISLESKRAPLEKQNSVRKLGIGIAVGLRIVLLFLLTGMISMFTNPIFGFPDGGPVEGVFTFESIIVLFGGGFILYTAVKEIFHMIGDEHLDSDENRKTKSAGMVIATIVLMNVVFSFDSILSAMALAQQPMVNEAGEAVMDANGNQRTDYIMWVMVIAIVISGILMIWLADKVSSFLEKNRLYEVLGLFVLLVVGIMLLTEGAHKSHLKFFGNEIEAMSKTTFYFVIGVLVVIDIVQSKYQRKLLAQREGTQH